jgi:hypothetical protein
LLKHANTDSTNLKTIKKYTSKTNTYKKCPNPHPLKNPGPKARREFQTYKSLSKRKKFPSNKIGSLHSQTLKQTNSSTHPENKRTFLKQSQDNSHNKTL